MNLSDTRSVPRLVCLLPARNAADDLEGYFESVSRFADVVVALDDGSTDDTRAILEQQPLVGRLVTNPRRESYRGWNDAENRNRLLAAAADLEPDWIISLDADERIDPDDAKALKSFLRDDALPGCAYGLQHYRMWQDRGYDPKFTWIYRLFAFSPDQSFPARRLHFDPVPTAIPRNAWIKTTVRVRHLAASTEERRRSMIRKYEEADPEAELGRDFGGLWEAPAPGLPTWTPRPPDMPVLIGPSDRGVDWNGATASAASPRLVCLLPARNAADDLEGYFESVSRFADVVVALDDGSTDDTRAILEQQPLVGRLVTNPRRESYRGWNDAENRNRLLAAAADLEPDWIISLDADERIDPDDAKALREFIDAEASQSFAYGFRVFRMVGGPQLAYDRAGLWVYRLFHFERGQRFPPRELHGVPVPDSIPRARWVKTTIRVQHFGGGSDHRRRQRVEKYRQADPDNRFQADYQKLLEPSGEVLPWPQRPRSLPVIAESEGDHAASEVLDLASLDLDGPVLSAIVISHNDEDRIEPVVRAVTEQQVPEPFEVIVVTSGQDRTADVVRRNFPGVTVVELEGDALPGRARNAGLRLARGDLISFPGSHVELPPGSLAARIEAHDLGYAMVTGTTLNGNTTPSGWAAYFLDHSSVLPGRPSEPLRGPPAHCSYQRECLLEVGGFPEGMRAGEDTVVNVELTRRGYRAYRARDVTIVHRSPCRTPGRLLRHHFTRGRALGLMMLAERRQRGLRKSRSAAFLVWYLPRRLRQTTRNVRVWGNDLWPVYRRVRPLVMAGAVSAWLGACYELAKSRPRRRHPGAPRGNAPGGR